MTQYPDLIFRKHKAERKTYLFEVAEDCDFKNICVIEKGFVTDFASIPRFLWSLLPPHGRMANASVVHDWMYDNRYLQEKLGEKAARKNADYIFLDNMLHDGVNVFQAILYYRVVRLFARKWWID